MREDRPDSLSLAALLAAVRPLAEAAGRAALAFYGGQGGQQAGAREKADGSPVTRADEAAEAVILPALRALTPAIPVVSEEEVALGRGPACVGARFWLVDPLDGTKEFLSGRGEFTVNIALIEDGRPVLGVVVAPALGETYGGTGGEAYLIDAAGERTILCRAPPAEGETVVGSRSHGDAAAMAAFLKGRRVAAFRAAGSSLKLCLIARVGRPISTPASARPWNGISPRVTRCWRPPAAASRRWTERPSSTASRISATRISWPVAPPRSESFPHVRTTILWTATPSADASCQHEDWYATCPSHSPTRCPDFLSGS